MRRAAVIRAKRNSPPRSFAGPRWYVRSVRLLLAMLLLASPAWAGPAEDAALKANQVRDQHCAEMAADRTSSMTSALVAVAPVLDEVSRVYEETKAPYLLYWRGTLLQCSGQESRAREDLRTFVVDAGNQRFLPDLVRDAERRLRHLEPGGPQPVGLDFGPRATVSLGGGYGLLADASSPHHYGGLALDGSIQIIGPLRAVVFGRFGWGTARETVDGTERSALIPVGAGVGVRLGDAFGFRAQVRLDVAPNQVPELADEAMVGISGLVGGAFQLGAIPIELRPEATFGVLGTFFHLSVGVSVGVRIGG